MKLFRRKRDGEEPPAEVYAGLRRQVLNLTPDQLDEESFADAPIVALLMETGYPEAVATLVAVVDGATSLYFSNGGGFIGCGEHATVAEASERWLASGQDVLPKLSAISDPALPAQGRTQFLAVTPGGLRGSVAQEEELGAGQHDLSPLFHAGQDVITQIRLTQGG
jgi:hypothetical protein